MPTFLSAVGLLAAWCAALVIAVSVIDEVRHRSGRPTARRAATARAVVKLATLVVIVGVVPLSARLAERATGWVDDDGNGVLDPMAMGSYDWVDINVGPFVRRAGPISAAIVVFAMLVLRHVLPPPEADASGEPAGD